MDNNNNFDLFNSFKDIDNLTIIKSKEGEEKITTQFIPPNYFIPPHDGLILKNDATAIEFPDELPQNSLDCSVFLRKFMGCHSPSGFLQGLYMYGENRCNQEDQNLYNCYQIQFSSSRESRNNKMDEILKKKIEKENEFYKDHVWKRRTPLIFKTYKEREKENYLNDKPLKSNVDNQLFGYNKELFQFLSDEKNSNRISEIKIYRV
ncbi:hypothetical protein ACTFIZ_007209 [Dictyostelium cf. discoideum]